jgi:hypothetical protein
LFLGIWCSITDQSVSLTAERVAELSEKLRALLVQHTVTEFRRFSAEIRFAE